MSHAFMTPEPDPEKVVSPKVLGAAITSGVLLIVSAMLTAVTPDLLAPLGAWSAVVMAGIVSTASVLVAFIKRDPLR
jgi:hypothetical protein